MYGEHDCVYYLCLIYKIMHTLCTCDTFSYVHVEMYLSWPIMALIGIENSAYLLFTNIIIYNI
jgi:hypothetical protein